MASDTPRHEYRIVTVTALRARAGAAEQERLLNEMAGEGWDLIDARRSDIWDWSWTSKDQLVLRRGRPLRDAPPDRER